MSTWDSKTTDCLRAIEAHAKWISHYCEGAIKQHAAQLEYAIKLLPERPSWETKAQDELIRSAETLRLTLALCQSALAAYHIKPVIVEHTEAAE